MRYAYYACVTHITHTLRILHISYAYYTRVPCNREEYPKQAYDICYTFNTRLLKEDNNVFYLFQFMGKTMHYCSHCDYQSNRQWDVNRHESKRHKHKQNQDYQQPFQIHQPGVQQLHQPGVQQHH